MPLRQDPSRGSWSGRSASVNEAAATAGSEKFRRPVTLLPPSARAIPHTPPAYRPSASASFGPPPSVRDKRTASPSSLEADLNDAVALSRQLEADVERVGVSIQHLQEDMQDALRHVANISRRFFGTVSTHTVRQVSSTACLQTLVPGQTVVLMYPQTIEMDADADVPGADTDADVDFDTDTDTNLSMDTSTDLDTDAGAADGSLSVNARAPRGRQSIYMASLDVTEDAQLVESRVCIGTILDGVRSMRVANFRIMP